ncbi:MAG: PhnD/SsuA/transferrin family substrate-binding protein [Cyanobacteria bacterium P01_C01_bin.38]
MQKNNRSRCASAAFLLVAVLAFLNSGCSNKVSSHDNLVIPAAAAISNDNMQPLRIGVLPIQSFEEQQQMIKPLENYLEKSLETEINFLVAKDYKQVVQWLVDGKADYTPIRELRDKLSLKAQRVK